MAKMGTVVARATNDRGGVLSLRSDRAILRQFRIDRRLEGATIIARIATSAANDAAAMARFHTYAVRSGYRVDGCDCNICPRGF